MDQKLKKKYLSIKEMGQRRGVSSKTLRYYDSIGIFKADYVDPDTGYRYYDPQQYEKLGTILELRSLNFSLNEIKGYFTERNMKKSVDMLKEHYKLLEEEIRSKQRLAETIKEKIDFIDKVIDNNIELEKFSFEDFPERFIISQLNKSDKSGESVALEFMHLEGHLHETAPILASDRIGFYMDFDDISEMENMDNWHTMIMCSEEMKNSRHFCVLPAGKYLCAYFKDYTADRDLFIKMFLEYVKFNDIKLKGIMIQQFKIDVTVTDNPKETIIEFQALV